MLFASDLDNTLIYSYKIARDDDICVEIKDGKRLSFMPPDSFSLLKEIYERCTFVPVTTRSLEQYRRIDLGVNPKYAIVAHGAILLIDGQPDHQWISETRGMYKTQLPALNENELIYDIRYVDDFFVFAKSDKPQEAVASLTNMLGTGEFEVCAVHNKVYVFPTGLNKGTALTRLSNQLLPERVVSAGDSVLDIPMLKMADTAIIPRPLGLSGDNIITLDEEMFVNRVLGTVIKSYQSMHI